MLQAEAEKRGSEYDSYKSDSSKKQKAQLSSKGLDITEEAHSDSTVDTAVG